jgi:hypothetical protein
VARVDFFCPISPAAAARLRGGAIAPRWIVFYPVRRVCHHQVRLDAAEHALDVRRDGAIAAEETMPPEQPQITQP